MNTRTNESWLADLRTSGAAHEEAIHDLREVIQKGLPYALTRWLSSDSPLFQPLVEEVTQETLLRVLDQLDTFEGRSLFTTWVHKIAIRLALTELRRKRWRDSSLDELTENEDAPPPPGLMADSQASPKSSAERADMFARVRRILEEELTPKQHEALVLLSLQDMPMDEAAKRMKTNRNALYKLLHDARLRLKKRLALGGPRRGAARLPVRAPRPRAAAHPDPAAARREREERARRAPLRPRHPGLRLRQRVRGGPRPRPRPRPVDHPRRPHALGGDAAPPARRPLNGLDFGSGSATSFPSSPSRSTSWLAASSS